MIAEVAKEQSSRASISLETLQERGGIILAKKEILRGCLKSHLQGGIIHAYGPGEMGLALAIATSEKFYVAVNERYNLLNVNTILTYLRSMKKEVKEEVIAEKAEGRKA